MEEKITALCQNFINNERVMKKVFRMESVFIYPIAANALSAYGVTADEAKLKECKKIIRRNAGTLSYLKGMIATPFAANLSMKEDPQAAFDKVVRFYTVTKKQFGRSDYSALLAIMLSDWVSEENLESVVTRGKELYNLMREKHPFLTSEKDSALAGFLALSQKGNTELIDDMEKCYDLLKIKFSNGGLREVAHILSLTDGAAREKVEHMIELYDMLRAAGKKYDGYYLSTLAAVSILDDNNEKLRDTILAIDDFLSKQKGYGLLGIDKKTRLIHATLLTADLYDSAQDAKNAATASSFAMAAAQQTAVSIIIASASSATTD